MNNPWFRFYNGAVEDPKVQRLSPAHFKFWVNCLCLASRNDGVLPPIADLEFSLRMNARAINSSLATLKAVGLLDDTETGVAPHNWNERQYKSDVSTSRVRKFRERQEPVPRNADETFHGTSPEQNRPEQSRADARGTDEKNFAALQKLLGFDGNDWKNWTEFTDMQTKLSLDFQAHILVAAEHHARSGKLGKTLAYIRPKAIEIRDQAKAAASAPITFEDGTDADWADRIKAYLNNPDFPPDIRWPAKWGKPFERVPPKVLEKFQSRLNANGSGKNAS